MMPHVEVSRSFPWWRFLAPRYWGLWLALGLLRLTVLLPFGAQLAVGRAVGAIGRRVLSRRRHIASVNLKLCFPELNDGARERLLREHFASLGIGLVEGAVCWWGDEHELRERCEIHGLDHLADARRDGVPVILLSAHFTTLEIGGRLLGLSTPFHLMYRPSKNKLLDEVIRRNRIRHFDRAIPRHAVKDMLKSLKDGFPVWYAPDQAYRGTNSELVPFFGHAVPTNTATSRLARIAGARVVPFFVTRLPGVRGYRLELGPPLDGFPSGDDIADTRRINELFERRIRDVPEQYLWIHRRFKVADDPYRSAR